MTTLVLVLFLSSLFGGEVRAELSFADRSSCERLVRTLTRFGVRHTVEQGCTETEPR